MEAIEQVKYAAIDCSCFARGIPTHKSHNLKLVNFSSESMLLCREKNRQDCKINLIANIYLVVLMPRLLSIHSH